MMKPDDRSLSIGILSFVIVAHLAIFFGIRLLNRPEPLIEPPGLNFVDLGMMGGGQAGSGDGQTAPPAEQPPAPPQTAKPLPPESKPQARNTVKPVVRRDVVNPDVRVPPPEEPTPPQRPIEHRIDPITPPPQQPTDTSSRTNTPTSSRTNTPSHSDNATNRTAGNQQTGSGQGGNAAGSGGGTGGGQGDGGGGGGEFVAPSHIGGYLNNPKPPYPPQLLDEGVSGTVRLRVMVEANGKPSSVEVLSASHPLFRRSAEETVRNQYTFHPATRGGQAIRHSYTFTIRFNAPR